MFSNHPKLAALGVFAAGGALVGAFSLAAGVAHGAGTTNPGAKESSAQYTAQEAWQETIPFNAATALSIPTGDRLTITSVLSPLSGGTDQCGLTTVVNGSSATYLVLSDREGVDQQDDQPINADSGSVTCTLAGESGAAANLVGYLTPIPAG